MENSSKDNSDGVRPNITGRIIKNITGKLIKSPGREPKGYVKIIKEQVRKKISKVKTLFEKQALSKYCFQYCCFFGHGINKF